MKYDKDIAIAIGYHFWDVPNDDRAEQAGMDCAIDIQKYLNRQENILMMIKNPRNRI